MIDILGWLLASMSVFGGVLNIFKIKWCFVVWFIANTGWIYYNVITETYPQIIIWVVYNTVSVIGFIKWNRDEKENNID
jgi:hypothetical protein